MNFVRVSGFLGRSSLCSSLVFYFLSLIFYFLSFFLADWIVYRTVPIKIGLWRVCDIQILGYVRCSDWTDRQYPTNLTNFFFQGAPDFVRTSQSLEIVAFIFMVISGCLLIFGIFRRSCPLSFFASSMSTFISIIFVSSTIGLFSIEGRSSHSVSLSFGFWLSVVSLVCSVVCGLSLLVLSFYIVPREREETEYEFNQNKQFYNEALNSRSTIASIDY